ncbi:acyl-coenzyme A thioesterase 8-like [Biomphalaria glabrata]|uniref:Acyl-coenzyme A thioesterase 8-like n=1 Tax=Biomphalaria glabrata TaxID=6526 RepID=A0A9W3AJB3_BIOGL|nr:acyl-coenzyme A thioesterase 8-like [Biomphalaria glabrata]XP_055887229.1 acyl-coenzyme A thioesterase 8-like [Biomphalaria glabrata]
MISTSMSRASWASFTMNSLVNKLQLKINNRNFKIMKNVQARSSSTHNTSSSSATENPELDSFLSRSFLDLEKIDENLFRSKMLWKHKRARGVYGGQMIGNCLVAASDGLPADQHLHSLHSYFHRKGTTDRPILFHVDKTRDGRTYCARSIKAVQCGNTIFTMQASFKKFEETHMKHQIPMPKVPYPDELKSAIEILDILKQEDIISAHHHELGIQWFQGFPMETRWVNPDTLTLLEPLYPKRSIWIKAEGHIGDSLHENVHKCCLAYLCDLLILPTSLMPYGPNIFRNFMTSLDHSMWFHAPCRADEWMLFEIEAENMGDGRAMCHGRIWDINGNHITTVAQEGVVRPRETNAS